MRYNQQRKEKAKKIDIYNNKKQTIIENKKYCKKNLRDCAWTQEELEN